MNKIITVIIPISEIKNDSEKKLLEKSINSINNEYADLIVVAPSKIEGIDFIKENKSIILIENTSENLSYQYQVNLAVENVNTKYFSVLEFDDAMYHTWLKNVSNYIENDTEEISVFLPLTEVVDYKSGKSIGYMNEAFWASSFSDEIGYPDMESMQNLIEFNMSGAVLKKDDFLKLGKLKCSMKASFWYEYILRILYKGKKCFVIPKIGCYHTINRNESLSQIQSLEMDEKEYSWWIDLANKEYYFNNDRNKTYEKEY